MSKPLRYRYIDELLTGHECCFGYTILDTSREGDEYDQSIAEVFDEWYAVAITAALNNSEM